VGINPTEQDGYGSYPTGSSNISGAQSNITIDTQALRIDCSSDAYTVGIQSPTGNCGGTGTGGFLQVGWIKSAGGSFTMVDYLQRQSSGTGCGTEDFPVSNLSGSHLYGTVAVAGCIRSYQWKYYLDGVLEDSQCGDFSQGNLLVEFGERLGSTNQMGNIGFWWIKYCTASLGCTPSIAPGAPPWPARIRCGLNQTGGCGYNGHIGWYGISQQSWPNFNVCDNSLSSSQC
jgi:hypothetical protein